MTNETTNQESTEAEAEHVPSAFETELAVQLRNIGVGRVNSAFILAKMLAPLLEPLHEKAVEAAELAKAAPAKKAKAK